MTQYLLWNSLLWHRQRQGRHRAFPPVRQSLAGFVEDEQENHAQRADNNRKFNVGSLVCYAVGTQHIRQRHQRNSDDHTDDIAGGCAEDAHLVALLQALGAHDKNGAVGDHDRRRNNSSQEHIGQEQVGDLCKAGQACGHGE